MYCKDCGEVKTGLLLSKQKNRPPALELLETVLGVLHMMGITVSKQSNHEYEVLFDDLIRKSLASLLIHGLSVSFGMNVMRPIQFSKLK